MSPRELVIFNNGLKVVTLEKWDRRFYGLIGADPPEVVDLHEQFERFLATPDGDSPLPS